MGPQPPFCDIPTFEFPRKRTRDNRDYLRGYLERILKGPRFQTRIYKLLMQVSIHGSTRNHPFCYKFLYNPFIVVYFPFRKPPNDNRQLVHMTQRIVCYEWCDLFWLPSPSRLHLHRMKQQTLKMSWTRRRSRSNRRWRNLQSMVHGGLLRFIPRNRIERCWVVMMVMPLPPWICLLHWIHISLLMMRMGYWNIYGIHHWLVDEFITG